MDVDRPRNIHREGKREIDGVVRRGVKGGGEEFEITTQTEGTEPSGQSTWPTTSCWAQNRLTNQLCGHFLDYITPQPLLSPMYSLDYRAINLDPRPRTYNSRKACRMPTRSLSRLVTVGKQTLDVGLAESTWCLVGHLRIAFLWGRKGFECLSLVHLVSCNLMKILGRRLGWFFISRHISEGKV